MLPFNQIVHQWHSMPYTNYFYLNFKEINKQKLSFIVFSTSQMHNETSILFKHFQKCIYSVKRNTSTIGLNILNDCFNYCKVDRFNWNKCHMNTNCLRQVTGENLCLIIYPDKSSEH